MVEPAPGATAPPQELRARYHEAFRAWLAHRDERQLGAAYALGREAVSAQLSVLDLSEAHHEATREEVLQQTVEAAQSVLGASHATISSSAGDPYSRGLSAAWPAEGQSGDAP